MEAFYKKKEGEKAAAKAAKKADREERKAKSAVRKKEREENAARKAEEKKNSTVPSTIVLSPSSFFEWTSTPVSSTTPARRISIGIPSSLG
jgi:septal ring factor EnvC (AmiA/AmiB activator)